MQSISSLKNPLIQAVKALQHKTARDETGMFLCEGEHMVGEAIAYDSKQVTAVFVDEARTDAYANLLAAVKEGKSPIYAVPEHVLAALSQVKTPQGIAATVYKPRYAELAQLGNRLVLLENVQDPGNVGTIVRSADAAGFDGCVLTPGCADAFSPKVLRATMGSIFRVPLAQMPDAPEAARALTALGYAVIATALDGDDFYTRKALQAKVCLMIGNEGAGITPQAKVAATHRYSLPMRGGAESLNAAVAAAIFMYELVNRP